MLEKLFPHGDTFKKWYNNATHYKTYLTKTPFCHDIIKSDLKFEYFQSKKIRDILKVIKSGMPDQNP